MNQQQPTIVPKRRTVTVLITHPGGAGLTLQPLPGDVLDLTPEEADQVIRAGTGVPAQLIPEAPPQKPRSRRRKKGAKA